MNTIEDEEWIIWNSALGLRDFVMIGEIDTHQRKAWLDSPYQMVGPFSLDELRTNGLISFAQCVVMSKQKWQDERESLLEVSRIRRHKSQQEFFEELEKRNRQKRELYPQVLVEYRSLLNLPTQGSLELSQIKSAYRKTAKKAHPDAGGNHELFVRIKEAYDALLELV
jgi:hypothetical protein